MGRSHFLLSPFIISYSSRNHGPRSRYHGGHRPHREVVHWLDQRCVHVSRECPSSPFRFSLSPTACLRRHPTSSSFGASSPRSPASSTVTPLSSPAACSWVCSRQVCSRASCCT